MDTHWFSSHKKGVAAAAGKAFRISSVFALLALTFGPLPNAPLGGDTPGAQADSLEWGDARPPLTDESDSDDTGGFMGLVAFGNELHAVAVAANGDIFTSGGTVAGNPTVYRSTNGGMNWRMATESLGSGAGSIATIPAGATINKIAISPDYPSDNTVVVVFSNRDAAGGGATDGIAVSRDGGVSFGAITAGATDFAGIDPRTFALSPDFNASDGSGFAAIGGIVSAGAASVFRIGSAALVDGTPGTGWTAMTCTGCVGGVAATDGTIDLGYSPDEEPITLGQLFVKTGGAAGVNFQGLIASGTDFVTGGGGGLLDIVGATASTAAGGVAFDDDYELNGTWFAAVGVHETLGGDGGVYRYSGAWEEVTDDEQANCKDVAFSSVAAAGNASSAKIIASRAVSNVVCRSTNNGNSWSDDEADGDPDIAEGRIETTVSPTNLVASMTRVARQRGGTDNVFWTSSGNLGGLAMSSNGGGTWRDTGLTNQAYKAQAAPDFISDTEVLVLVRVGGAATARAIFYTNNWGTGAGWRRVDRTPDMDAIELPDDIATSKTVWAHRRLEGDERVVRSTDGGMTFFATGANPVDDETIRDLTPLTSSTAYVGTDEGLVYVTRDGGTSWTQLAKDFGRDIDEVDFASETVFFYSAIDSDNFAKVWQTRDGGATFTQIGDTPWGTGCESGNLSFRLAKYDATKNEGWGIFMTEDACTTDEVYRIQIGGATPASTWTDMDLDILWENIGSWRGRAGDGYYLWFWQDTDDGGGRFVYTTVPLTGDTDDMSVGAGGGLASPTGGEADNLLLTLPNPPDSGCSFNSARPANTVICPVQTPAAVPAPHPAPTSGRYQVFTAIKEFLDGPEPTSPGNMASVPANTGDEGVPLSLRWNDIPGADCYEVILGQNPDLSDGAILVGPGGTCGVNGFSASRATITAAIEPLVQGITYYWAARVSAAEGSPINGEESPWSPIRSFSVSTTSPTVNVPSPNLPLNGSQLPGLGGELSWNNPPGTSQVQIQIRPLNDDGPAINLIIGSAITRYVVPAPVFGTGPYVMLPGATYTWRTRVTGSASATITENDNVWGPWSEPRTFTTRRPDAGTLQLLAPINGETVSDTTPSLSWKNAATDEFYYEIQLSADPNFNMDPRTATASVFWNLIHGGQSNPPNSWTVPDANALRPGTYYWRVRQRLQATPAGSAEVGIAWSPAQRFVLQ